MEGWIMTKIRMSVCSKKGCRFMLIPLMLVILGYLSSCTSRSPDEDLIQHSGIVRKGETQFYYEEIGEGTPIVMIHGGLLDRRMWDDQFEVFGRDYRVIRYDVRAHGLTKSSPDSFSHHEDLLTLLDTLKIPKAVVIGLSLGGYISIDFTLAYPERVLALIPVSPGLTGFKFTSEPFMEMQRNLNEAAQKGDLVQYCEVFQQAWTDGPRRSAAQVDTAVRNTVRRIAMETLENWDFEGVEMRLDPPAVQRLDHIGVPVLVVIGDMDIPEILQIGDLIIRDVPHAQRVILRGAAHMVNMEKPEEFNRTVHDFLDRVLEK
jgi:pimeloyl-ACP methyl ester carboxylesterase